MQENLNYLQILINKEKDKEKRNVIYEKLFDKYGDLQLIIAIEELSELQKEICKCLRKKGQINNLIEEIADVKIMLEQIIYIYGLCEEEIDVIVDNKIKRTEENLL